MKICSSPRPPSPLPFFFHSGKLKIVNGAVVGEDAFFNDPAVGKLYKAHLDKLANRVNSINGKKYKDDPTIMAWNLINEPRCESPAGCGMQEWVAEMAPYAKTVLPNQLITIGADGFYSAASCLADKYNPFLWAGYTGEKRREEGRGGEREE